VVVAVVLPVGFRHEILTDSKKLSETSRERLYAELTALPGLRWSCIRIAPAEIDERNILRATHEGMRRAVLALQPQPDHALVDGLPVPLFPIPHTALVKGDSLSWSIAAASVLAKVTRDRLMCEADLLFPEYGFARHKGYGTQAHLEALRKHGPTPLHRRTFLPVAQAELFTTI
jgi:ribonuclease HII